MVQPPKLPALLPSLQTVVPLEATAVLILIIQAEVIPNVELLARIVDREEPEELAIPLAGVEQTAPTAAALQLEGQEEFRPTGEMLGEAVMEGEAKVLGVLETPVDLGLVETDTLVYAA